MRWHSGPVSVPMAAMDARLPTRTRSAELLHRAALPPPDSAAQQAAQGAAAALAAAAGTGREQQEAAQQLQQQPLQHSLQQASQQQQRLVLQQQQQQLHQQKPQHRHALAPPVSAPQLPAQLPPSRPLAEFLSSSGAVQQHSGEEAFRVLCQVCAAHCFGGRCRTPTAPNTTIMLKALHLDTPSATPSQEICPARLNVSTYLYSCCLQVLGFLRATHARGAALGRLRPSGLRVTASCIVLMDPGAQIPPEEEELYAAPEELFARAQLTAADALGAAAVGGGSAHSNSSGPAHGGGRIGSDSSVGGSGGSSDNLAGAVPAAGATGGRLPSGALPLQHDPPPPQRTPAGDMFSLGLLLLQLLHPVGGGVAGDRSAGSSSTATAPAADSESGAAPAAAEQAQRMLRDARHQILPSALLQVCHRGCGFKQYRRALLCCGHDRGAVWPLCSHLQSVEVPW